MNHQTIVLAAAGGANVGIFALILAVVLLLSWMGYLFINSRRSRASANEPAPSNLSPGISDAELENEKLTRVLRAALYGSILMAVVMPWYALNEPGRQEVFAEELVELDIEEGAHRFSHEGFACADCHGPTAGGGAAPFVEPRSGVDTAWAAPSLNDVFYRYEPDEVRFWIVFGRDGTPMPANGLEGGGAMTVQEIDQVMAFLLSIQVTQQEAFEKSQSRTDFALSRIAGGQASTEKLIEFEEFQIARVEAAQEKLGIVGAFPDDMTNVLATAGTCTVASAALVGATCEQPGTDADRDGLTDEAERFLTGIAAVSYEELTTITYDEDEKAYSFTSQKEYNVYFDPLDSFTNGEPDLVVAEEMLSKLGTDVLLVEVAAERAGVFLVDLESGLAFLEDALDQRFWDIDFDKVASDMGVSVDDAKLAVGLFNGSCARCHTAGFSAGASFEQGAGTGAWGPSLVSGRAVIQFPDIEDHIAFVTEGSENAVKFGINGLGSGRMPSFGRILSESQIELIVKYERTL